MFKLLPVTAVSLILAANPTVKAQVVDDIANVHPAYTLSQLRPAAWHPQVAGMDLLPDGKMLILEMREPGENTSNKPKKDGWLYLVDNPGAGSMENKIPLTIKAVQLSPDRKKVFLQMDVTAHQVLIIKTAGVKSQTGEAVRCPAGWYTLNSISSSVAFDPAVAVSKPANVFAGDIKVLASGRGMRVSLPFAGVHELTLKTLQGRTVALRPGNGPQVYALDRNDFRPGIYLLEVKAGGTLLRKSLIL